MAKGNSEATELCQTGQICPTPFATNASRQAIMPTNAQIGNMATMDASQTAPAPVPNRANCPRARVAFGRTPSPATSTCHGDPLAEAGQRDARVIDVHTNTVSLKTNTNDSRSSMSKLAGNSHRQELQLATPQQVWQHARPRPQVYRSRGMRHQVPQVSCMTHN